MKIDIKQAEPAQAKMLAKEVDRLSRVIQAYHDSNMRSYVIPQKKPSNTIRFGLYGDTQLGSRYERVDAVHKFYQILKDEKIDVALHSGDVLDGWKIYKGQEFEIYAQGMDQQLQVFNDQMPNEGIKTIFITGNHDESFTKLCGAKMGDRMMALRPDCKYIGASYGRVKLLGKDKSCCLVDLVHPSGGTAYAISYHAQKYVESISGGTKPHIVGIGHYHKSDWLPVYRNVSVFQTGCFQSQTPFMRNKGLAAHIGGWIVEIVVGDPKKLTQRIKAEFISFYEPQEYTLGEDNDGRSKSKNNATANK